jgi:hypothetical protein
MMMSTVSDTEFERMAELVRRDDPSLTGIQLAPDGKYQTRTASLGSLTGEVTECLAEGFRRRGSDEFPTFYSGWGRCRVGSTALANLFGVAGLPSYQQPVKAILRQRLRGEAGDPIIPPSAAEHPHVFSKETAGPYVAPECLVIPLQALVEAGYPPNKLHLIVLDREPFGSLASWLAIFTQRVPANLLARNHILAALNVLRVKSYAKRHGIPTTHYVHEASKEPIESARALFERLGLSDRFTAASVTNWKDGGEIASKKAKLIFTTEPKIYDVPGALRSATGYEYRIGAAAPLSTEHVDMLTRFGIPEIYRESARACAQDLRMSNATAERLFGSETASDRELVAAE